MMTEFSFLGELCLWVSQVLSTTKHSQVYVFESLKTFIQESPELLAVLCGSDSL